jgi:phosphatidylglycerol---prolipoprotein diacylglyceryl transferase
MPSGAPLEPEGRERDIMRPPFGPYLIDHLFGLPFLSVRWYGAIIMIGATLAALIASGRARERGQDREHVWGLLMWGLVLGIACARAYYVAFEWQRYASRPLLEILNPQGGGIAIHGAILGAALAALLYTRRHHLPLVPWLDICVPTLLIGQGIGRWGNFFNQEAYGRPTTLPWGLDIHAAHRIPPYTDLGLYPVSTRFHPTFLYESLWDLSAFGAILLIERRLHVWLRPGDSALLYGVLYSLGRFFTEGLRTDSLCIGPYLVDGSCAGGLRIAQVVSLATLVLCGAVLVWRHRFGRAAPPPPTTAAPRSRRAASDG